MMIALVAEELCFPSCQSPGAGNASGVNHNAEKEHGVNDAFASNSSLSRTGREWSFLQKLAPHE